MVHILIGFLVGIAMGFASNILSISQLKKRTDDDGLIQSFKRPIVICMWCLLVAIISAVVFYQFNDWIIRIEYVIIASIAISIASIDGTIKRIPNDSLLILLAIKVIAIIAIMLNGGSFKESVVPSFLGLVIGMVLYYIPSMFHIPIGAGDIKYCAVIGFTLGIYGFLESVIFMALSLSLYLLYLKVTKKGNLRTSAAMGPYLTFGVIVTLLAPMQQFITLI